MITNPSPDSAFLTKAEAAELLRVKGRTLDDWMRRKIVPFSRLPTGTVRFRRERLSQFIAKYEQCSEAVL